MAFPAGVDDENQCRLVSVKRLQSGSAEEPTSRATNKPCSTSRYIRDKISQLGVVRTPRKRRPRSVACENVLTFENKRIPLFRSRSRSQSRPSSSDVVAYDKGCDGFGVKTWRRCRLVAVRPLQEGWECGPPSKASPGRHGLRPTSLPAGDDKVRSTKFARCTQIGRLPRHEFLLVVRLYYADIAEAGLWEWPDETRVRRKSDVKMSDVTFCDFPAATPVDSYFNALRL